MGKELPLVSEHAEDKGGEPLKRYVYCRVFCQRDNSPPLRLLCDFLKARGQAAIISPNIDETALDEWAWVQMALGYDKNRKPIQLFCLRDRGSYKDLYEQEKKQFLELLSVYDDVEPQLIRAHIASSRFILTTRIDEKDITEEGYDFNGWILQFYQEQCHGIVQIDGIGFYSPKGDLVIDLSDGAEDDGRSR
ncbi:MAG: hypothetical protein NNA20_11800 [Nitrospira sp.]|nr:hypothetical protein [Nitrospira sp.]